MKEINLNITARISGFLYLLMATIGFFGIMYVPTHLIITGDMAATAGNIMANEMLFRLGIMSALITQIIQIALVLFLYKLLKQVNKRQAILMTVFILVAVPIAMLNEVTNFAVLQLGSEPHYLVGFTTEQLQGFMSLFLELHANGIIIAQLFWGLWLFPLGYLVVKSGYIPKLFGVMLMIGSVGYVIDSATLILFPNLGITVSEFTFVGELLFPLWLVVKGVNDPLEE